MPQHPVASRDLLFNVAHDLIVKGWQPVWCLQRQSGGFSPMTGLTGYDAPFPTVVPQPPGAHRLGFRPPPEVVIFDVDHYDHKRGADTIDKAEAWLGDLPPTWKVTSRGVDNPSGRYLYRKPADLDFSDSALAQFADDNGKTHVEILKTGWRYSWAPGDINHKNGLTVACFDPLGEPCWLPSVDELPELPPKWVEYLRRPPVSFTYGSYARPADGPQWWLCQADSSLSSDTELSGFAFNMMLSRVPIEEIFQQWLRVAHNDDPSWPWSREDFDRHVRSQAQSKAAEAIAREDSEEAIFEGIAGGPGQLQEIHDRAVEAKDRDDKLAVLRDQRIAETIAEYQLFPAQPLEEDVPQAPTQTFNEYVTSLIRGYPEYGPEFKRELVRGQAKADVQTFLARSFTGFRDISCLDDPPLPTQLTIIGKSANPQPLIAPGSITVISGHRSAGKTWVAAKWAEQQITAGSHVVWVDFERQDRGLNAKFKVLGLMPNAVGYHVHYCDEAPAIANLMGSLAEYGNYLLIIDAWRGLQGRVAPGTSGIDSDAVDMVYETYLNPFAKAGGTVVLLDHLPKNGDTTFGGERKESAADYVIRVEQLKGFTKAEPGFSSLTVTKDRWGEIPQNTTVGYLWMPGDGRESGASISKYPKRPEFRSWAPTEDAELAAIESSDRSRREQILIEEVSGDRLKYSINALAKAVMEGYPEYFAAESSSKRYIREAITAGRLVKEEGAQGKLDVPVMRAMEVHSPSGIRPEDLQHPEE